MPSTWADLPRQVGYFALAYVAYRVVRGMVENDGTAAFQHAREVISFERSLHIFVEPAVQAWASGSWFMLLQAMLGLRPNAPRRELHIFNPRLPAWLDWLRLRNLRIGASRVGLEFSRRGDRTFCNVIEVQGEALMISVDFR